MASSTPSANVQVFPFFISYVFKKNTFKKSAFLGWPAWTWSKLFAMDELCRKYIFADVTPFYQFSDFHYYILYFEICRFSPVITGMKPSVILCFRHLITICLVFDSSRKSHYWCTPVLKITFWFYHESFPDGIACVYIFLCFCIIFYLSRLLLLMRGLLVLLRVCCPSLPPVPSAFK